MINEIPIDLEFCLATVALLFFPDCKDKNYGSNEEQKNLYEDQ